MLRRVLGKVLWMEGDVLWMVLWKVRGCALDGPLDWGCFGWSIGGERVLWMVFGGWRVLWRVCWSVCVFPRKEGYTGEERKPSSWDMGKENISSRSNSHLCRRQSTWRMVQCFALYRIASALCAVDRISALRCRSH